MLGSLGTSVFDTDVYLVGASGGVYALLAAHLANVLLNYNNMEFGIVRLIGIFIVGNYTFLFIPPMFYFSVLSSLLGLTLQCVAEFYGVSLFFGFTAGGCF